MCYYVQKVYNFEILKMRAEFSKDENGTVRIIYSTIVINLYRFGSFTHLNSLQGQSKVKDNLFKQRKLTMLTRKIKPTY